MDKYHLTFKLTKHPQARKFESEVASTEENLQEKIEERTKYFADLFGTPVKCIKSRKINGD